MLSRDRGETAELDAARLYKQAHALQQSATFSSTDQLQLLPQPRASSVAAPARWCIKDVLYAWTQHSACATWRAVGQGAPFRHRSAAVSACSCQRCVCSLAKYLVGDAENISSCSAFDRCESPLPSNSTKIFRRNLLPSKLNSTTCMTDSVWNGTVFLFFAYLTVIHQPIIVAVSPFPPFCRVLVYSPSRMTNLPTRMTCSKEESKGVLDVAAELQRPLVTAPQH